VKGKTLSISLIALGLGCIAIGIILKRMFAMGSYLIIFHSMGGLLLVVGTSMLFLRKQE
jgi:hypothetical protein